MDWYNTVFELIDMRSFSNLWFWIALAVVWSSASHWILGVPWDMVIRARRGGAQPEADLSDMVRININRMFYVVANSGLLLAGLVAFLLTAALLLGFVYEVEFAQALFLLGFPLSIVGMLSLHTARVIRRDGLTGEALCKRLAMHRLAVQAIGMASIFVTAVWGMYHNMFTGPLTG
ncbi:component of SufBCD complex [Roseovarius salinarum]|uniref:component of SufBCD complex n=1 Tax=Roseovarius salinarum TaxID=1981892 RepID=UPI000C339397|nr:component of SufBCD complex [Roseovarius salinarum]